MLVCALHCGLVKPRKECHIQFSDALEMVKGRYFAVIHDPFFALLLRFFAKQVHWVQERDYFVILAKVEMVKKWKEAINRI
jgi:hypothetical protein